MFYMCTIPKADVASSRVFSECYLSVWLVANERDAYNRG